MGEQPSSRVYLTSRHVKILRVDQDFAVVLLLVSSEANGVGARSRWVFTRHLPPHVMRAVDEHASAEGNPDNSGSKAWIPPPSPPVSDRVVGNGNCAEETLSCLVGEVGDEATGYGSTTKVRREGIPTAVRDAAEDTVAETTSSMAPSPLRATEAARVVEKHEDDPSGKVGTRCHEPVSGVGGDVSGEEGEVWARPASWARVPLSSTPARSTSLDNGGVIAVQPEVATLSPVVSATPAKRPVDNDEVGSAPGVNRSAVGTPGQLTPPADVGDGGVRRDPQYTEARRASSRSRWSESKNGFGSGSVLSPGESLGPARDSSSSKQKNREGVAEDTEVGSRIEANRAIASTSCASPVSGIRGMCDRSDGGVESQANASAPQPTRAMRFHRFEIGSSQGAKVATAPPRLERGAGRASVWRTLEKRPAKHDHRVDTGLRLKAQRVRVSPASRPSRADSTSRATVDSPAVSSSCRLTLTLDDVRKAGEGKLQGCSSSPRQLSTRVGDYSDARSRSETNGKGVAIRPPLSPSIAVADSQGYPDAKKTLYAVSAAETEIPTSNVEDAKVGSEVEAKPITTPSLSRLDVAANVGFVDIQSLEAEQRSPTGASTAQAPSVSRADSIVIGLDVNPEHPSVPLGQACTQTAYHSLSIGQSDLGTKLSTVSFPSSLAPMLNSDNRDGQEYAGMKPAVAPSTLRPIPKNGANIIGTKQHVGIEGAAVLPTTWPNPTERVCGVGIASLPEAESSSPQHSPRRTKAVDVDDPGTKLGKEKEGANTSPVTRATPITLDVDSRGVAPGPMVEDAVGVCPCPGQTPPATNAHGAVIEPDVSTVSRAISSATQPMLKTDPKDANGRFQDTAPESSSVLSTSRPMVAIAADDGGAQAYVPAENPAPVSPTIDWMPGIRVGHIGSQSEDSRAKTSRVESRKLLRTLSGDVEDVSIGRNLAAERPISTESFRSSRSIQGDPLGPPEGKMTERLVLPTTSPSGSTVDTHGIDTRLHTETAPGPVPESRRRMKSAVGGIGGSEPGGDRVRTLNSPIRRRTSVSDVGKGHVHSGARSGSPSVLIARPSVPRAAEVDENNDSKPEVGGKAASPTPEPPAVTVEGVDTPPEPQERTPGTSPAAVEVSPRECTRTVELRLEPEVKRPVVSHDRQPKSTAEADGAEMRSDKRTNRSAVSPTRAPRPKTNIAGVEIRESFAGSLKRLQGGGRSKGTGDVARSPAAAATGWGVFSKRAVKRGDLVFRERALLAVSKREVNRRVWSLIEDVQTEVTCRMRSSANPVQLDAVDVLQPVLWHRAHRSRQERVLQLYAPDQRCVEADRLRGWNTVLDAMQRRGFFRSESDYQCDASELREELLRVLLICEVNIFGEDTETETEHGDRFLFETGCRVNHSCLPNCTYYIEGGQMYLRALCDLEPGEELTCSYLSFDSFLMPTPHRRQKLLSTKYFRCECVRCANPYDRSRGFRCPSCFGGSVCPKATEERRRGRGRGGPGEAAETSPCSRCGKVPPARWLESAQRVEMDVTDAVREFEYVENVGAGRALAILSATCGFLFVEHHALFMTHYLMAEGLLAEARYLEGAFHAHEAIVTGFAIANRSGRMIAQMYYWLGVALAKAAGLVDRANQERRDLGIPIGPHPGVSYMDLIRIRRPPPTPFETASGGTTERDDALGMVKRSGSGSADKTKESVEYGVCVACGRDHGRPWDNASPVSCSSSEREGLQRLLSPAETRLALVDSRQAFLKAAELYATTLDEEHGECVDARRMADRVKQRFHDELRR